jgi:hypothetical protein
MIIFKEDIVSQHISDFNFALVIMIIKTFDNHIHLIRDISEVYDSLWIISYFLASDNQDFQKRWFFSILHQKVYFWKTWLSLAMPN